MAQYAAPQYMNSHLTSYDSLPPGHRFGLFFKCWKSDWYRDDEGKKDGLKQVLELKTPVKDLIKALRLRQAAQAQTFSKGLYQISALSESPFMTGIGMEHPVENGFAFLNPYGIPYLPGSGVKGVLRRAAEELALGISLDDGWDLAAVWCLFGFEAGSLYLTGKPRPPLDEVAPKWWEHFNTHIEDLAKSPWLAFWMEGILRGQDRDIYLSRPKEFLQALSENKKVREKISSRGTLSFWDVLPEPGGDQLGMDILTPHYIDYYQGSSPPNDSGKPVPNPFLVMPPGSAFTFYVQCESNRLPETLAKSWQDLLAKAFEHAFDWLGFGAKTAVGYGQMVQNDQVMEESQKELAEIERREKEQRELTRKQAEAVALQAELDALSPVDREIWRLENGELSEEQVMKFYNSLTGMEDAERLKAAQALKEFWQVHGKWAKKDCSKKQSEKVQQVKKCLGEA